MRRILLFVALAGSAHAGALAPFTLDFSQIGGPAATAGIVIATGLNFPYGLSTAPDGSLIFGQTTTTYSFGLSYGWGPQATGSAWKMPKMPDGSFGAPVMLTGGFAGLVTGVTSLSDGTLVVDSGAGAGGNPGGTGNRVISFVAPGGQSLGSLTFNYPTDSYANWEHSNGLSLVVPGAGGSNQVYFIVGSKDDSVKTAATVSVSGLGLSNLTLNPDSVYMMTVRANGNSVQITSPPQQVVTGVRNPYGLSLDSAGNLIVGNNGIDGPHVVDETGADTLNFVPKAMIGQVYDFGFPDSYIDFATGQWINGDPTATLPLVAFTPVQDSHGVLQKSEGLAGMAFAPAGSFPFVGASGGEFVTFHGIFDAGGSDNTHDAVLYYDFTSGAVIPILDGGVAGAGHIDSVAISGHSLFLEDMSQTGLINGLAGLGGGSIYEFDFATPEPASLWLCLAGLIAAGAVRVRSRGGLPSPSTW